MILWFHFNIINPSLTMIDHHRTIQIMLLHTLRSTHPGHATPGLALVFFGPLLGSLPLRSWPNISRNITFFRDAWEPHFSSFKRTCLVQSVWWAPETMAVVLLLSWNSSSPLDTCSQGRSQHHHFNDSDLFSDNGITMLGEKSPRRSA